MVDAEDPVPEETPVEDTPLTRFLVSLLKPISEADPSLLANYVVALLKNNMPQDKLKVFCIEQLEDFLQEGAKGFVEKLFDAVEKGEVSLEEDTAEAEVAQEASGPAEPVVAPQADVGTDPPAEAQPQELDEESKQQGRRQKLREEGEGEEAGGRRGEGGRRRGARGGESSDDEEEGERNYRHRRLSGANEQKSGGEDLEAEGRARKGRIVNLSGRVENGSFEEKRRLDRDYPGDGPMGRRGGYHRGGFGLSGRGPRDGPMRGGFGRQGFDGPPDGWQEGGRMGYGEGRGFRGGRGGRRGGSGSWGPRGGGPGFNGPGFQGGPGLGPRPRCPDFEERGFCLKGDLCPLDHGNYRIVVEDMQQLQGVLPINSMGEGGALAMGVRGMGGGLIPSGMDHSGYDPDQSLWSTNAVRSVRAVSAPGELVVANGAAAKSVWERIGPNGEGGPPRNMDLVMQVDASGVGPRGVKRGRLGQGEGPGDGPQEFSKVLGPQESGRQGAGESGAGGPGVGGGGRGKASSEEKGKAQKTVFVHHIPQDTKNAQAALIQHFLKFGPVVDIRVQLDKGRAFVQFNAREQAESAVNAADAVLGNRFIRIHWANFDLQPDRVPGAPGQFGAGRGSGGPMFLPQGQTGTAPSAPGPSTGEAGTAASSAQQGGDSEKKEEKGEEKPTPVRLEELRAIQAKKEALLKQQIEQRKQYLEKLKQQKLKQQAEASGATAAAGDGTSQVAPGAEPAPKKAKPGEPEMPDPKGVKPTVPAAGGSPGGVPGAPAGYGSPYGRGRGFGYGRGAYYGGWGGAWGGGGGGGGSRFKLDNRTTVLRISPPIPSNITEASQLWEHFSGLGDVVSVEVEGQSGPAVIQNSYLRVKFATRAGAEWAFTHGCQLADGQLLEVSWAQPNPSVKTNAVAAAFVPGGGAAASSASRDTQKGEAPAVQEGAESTGGLPGGGNVGANIQAEEARTTPCTAEGEEVVDTI